MFNSSTEIDLTWNELRSRDLEPPSTTVILTGAMSFASSIIVLGFLLFLLFSVKTSGFRSEKYADRSVRITLLVLTVLFFFLVLRSTALPASRNQHYTHWYSHLGPLFLLINVLLVFALITMVKKNVLTVHCLQ